MNARTQMNKTIQARRINPAAISVWIPVKIESEANLREHWRVRNKRKQDQQLAVIAGLKQFEPMLRSWPAWKVTLTRAGKRMLDDDNLAGGFKAVRDQIAKICDCDDGNRERWSWNYDQMTGKIYAVRIHIERVEVGARLCVVRIGGEA